MSDVSQLEGIITDYLFMYSKDIEQGIQNEVDKTMKEFVSNTKKDAPVRFGAYKRAISSKKVNGSLNEYTKVWYVKAPYYRLTHLLNNGHAKRGGGRVNGDNHITHNERIAVTNFARGVKGVIERSGC